MQESKLYKQIIPVLVVLVISTLASIVMSFATILFILAPMEITSSYGIYFDVFVLVLVIAIFSWLLSKQKTSSIRIKVFLISLIVSILTFVVTFLINGLNVMDGINWQIPSILLVWFGVAAIFIIFSLRFLGKIEIDINKMLSRIAVTLLDIDKMLLYVATITYSVVISYFIYYLFFCGAFGVI